MTLQNIYVQRFLGLVFVVCAAAAATFLLLHQTRPATAESDGAAADQLMTISDLSVDNDDLLEAPFVEEGVLAAYPVLLDPLALGGFGQPAAFVTHTIYLDNVYWNDTSYSLSLEPGYAWPATVVPTQTAVLTPGMRIPITVSVAVPPDAAEGDMDSLTLQAVADSAPSVNETALVDTAVICEPHLVIGPQKEEIDATLDQVYEYAGQYFAYALVHARNTSGSYWHTFDATISGYDPDTDSWMILAELVNSDAGPVIHQPLWPPTYTKIRVELDNNSPMVTNLIYTYQFALCREPAIFWEPTAHIGYAAVGTTAVYTQTLTNWTMASTPFTLTTTGHNWPVTLWHEGTPLTTTAVLDDQGSLDFEIHVVVPPDAEPGDLDVVNVAATAVASPTIQSSVTITTTVIGDPVYVAMGQGSRLGIVDSASNIYLQTIDLNQYNCSGPQQTVITPDGQHLYVSCTSSAKLLVIEIDTNTVIATIDISAAAGVTDMAFSRDGQYVFVTRRWNNTLLVIDTTTFAQTTIPMSAYTHYMAAHPILDRLYLSADQSQIIVIDTSTLTIIDTIGVSNTLGWIEVSPDGRWLFATRDGSQMLWMVDLNTHLVTVMAVDDGDMLTDLAFSPDGATLYLGDYNKVHVIDTNTLTEEAVIPVPGTVWAVELTCDGSQLYVSSQQDTLFAIDTDNLAVTHIPLPASGSRGVAACSQYAAGGVVLSPPQQQKQAALGETAVYTTTIYNRTGQSDTIDLALDGATWPAALSTTSIGPLADGESASFTVSVTVPDEANWYETDVVTIVATSVTSPTVYSDTAVLTTEAFAPAQLTFDPTSLSLTQEVNSQVTQTVTLSNGNGVTLTFALQTAQHLPLFDPVALSPAERPDGWPEVEMTTTGSMPLLPLYDDPPDALPPLVTILTDPLGDGGPADVVEVLAGRTDTAVSMQIKFAPGVNMQQLFGYVLLDTDQDTSTGRPATFFNGLSTQEVGVDYVVSFFSDVNSLGIYTAFFQYLGDVTRYYSADSIFFTIPLSMLDDDDGHMNIALVLGNVSGPTEWVPEVGNGVVGASFTAWLTAEPVTGTVAPNDSLMVTASLDSTGLQPGLYPANLHIHSNDPTTPVASLPITMTVEPTASMGWVEGTIRDGRFHHPLVADVVAQGEPYLVTSDEDGTYRLWLEAGTYTLEVTAVGYVSTTVPIAITAQSATVQDIDLIEDVPVFGLSPDSLTLTLSAGTIMTETAVVTNDGPAQLTFATHAIDTTDTLIKDTNLNQETVRLLTWTRHSDPSKYQNLLAALSQQVDFTLIETDTEDAVILSGLLHTVDVLLIPDQGTTIDYLYNRGIAWADALQIFLQRGGTIVLLDHCSQRTSYLLRGAGLIMVDSGYCDYHSLLNVLESGHPLAQGLPDLFNFGGGIAVYRPLSADNVVRIQNHFGDDIVVFAREINRGRVAVLGFDFFSYSDEVAQLLANAVQWYEPSSSWLTATPITGTVAAYDSLPLSLVIDTTGLYPGDYTADLIVSTNDPYTSTRTLSLNLTVEPSATMGQVVGTVQHAWTGEPLTATVALQGVYTTTATPDFAIWAEAGDYTLTAVADGYVPMAINVSIPAGDVVEVDLQMVPLQPRLEGMIESVTETAVTGQTIMHTFTLTNAGPVALNYEWSAGAAWLLLEPAAGAISAYGSQSFTLLLDATALPPDVYEAALSLTHNDPELVSPLTVPVTFSVQEDDEEVGVWLYLPVIIRP
jgi:WD40 repeat protein